MNNVYFRVFAGLVLLAAIAGLGYFAYNAGVAQGTVVNLPASAGETPAQPYPYFGYGYGMRFWHPFPFLGFGCFGLVLPLILLVLAFGAFRRMLWGPRWGWHHMHHMHGPGWMGGEGEAGVPPFFAEWHKRLHGESESDKQK